MVESRFLNCRINKLLHSIDFLQIPRQYSPLQEGATAGSTVPFRYWLACIELEFLSANTGNGS